VILYNKIIQRGDKILKIKYIPMVIFLFVPFVLFGQFFEYVSLGYNTVETIYNNKKIIEHYLSNNPNYSKMWIYGDTDIMFEIGRPHKESSEIHIIPFNFRLVPHYQYEEEEGYYMAEHTQIWRITNGRLSYVELSWDSGSKVFANKIEYTSEELTVYLDNNSIMKFYNIDENELLDKFLTKYVNEVFAFLNGKFTDRLSYISDRSYISGIKRDYDQGRTNNILNLLPHLKRQELAIIRNCLFAKYNYAFQTQYWNDFIQKYYLKDFNGVYSNSEVLARFTNDEKWLLNLIIEYEKTNE
jgi:hypothetical protein